MIKIINHSLRVVSDNLVPSDFEMFYIPQQYLLIRHFLEISVILALMPLIIFLTLLISIIIKIDSRGTIFFKQQRPGLNCRMFTIYKFRTMNGIANGVVGHDRSRVTKAGAIIRKFRLDEIPQVINILKGEMSLIGPRPEPDFYFKEWTKHIPFYDKRYMIKPGLTGLAQVMYRHTDEIRGAGERAEYDFYYMLNISPNLDLKILMKTIKVVITGKLSR